MTLGSQTGRLRRATVATAPATDPGRGHVRRGGAGPRLTEKHRERLAGMAFVTPQVVGYAVFVVFPIVSVFWYSLHDWNVLQGEATLAGLGNYQSMAADPSTRETLANSAMFTIGLVPLNIALALFLAVMLNQKLRGTAFFRTVFFVPVVVSLVAWAIVWRFLLEADGGINMFLQMVGIEGPNWLREPGWAMASVVVVQVLKSVGLNMTLFLAALQTVPNEVIEASIVDGANVWTRFRRILFPLISPMVLLVTINTVIGSLQVFATIKIMTDGGPGRATNVLVFEIYRQAFERFEAGYASALAVLLFAIVLILTLMQWHMRKRWVYLER
jgi:multiple sugar transport system permease protein